MKVSLPGYKSVGGTQYSYQFGELYVQFLVSAHGPHLLVVGRCALKFGRNGRIDVGAADAIHRSAGRVVRLDSKRLHAFPRRILQIGEFVHDEAFSNRS